MIYRQTFSEMYNILQRNISGLLLAAGCTAMLIFWILMRSDIKWEFLKITATEVKQKRLVENEMS